MSLRVPRGFRLAGVHCGIKSSSAKQDLSLIVTDRAATAAGVYTQNMVFAAPVGYDRQRTPSNHVRGVVINSGNANACTGQRGDRDAAAMAGFAAESIGAAADDVLVMSTGIIGKFLPLDKIAAGVRMANELLAHDEAALLSAARGILTTDTRHKVASRTLWLGGRDIVITGMAKGAAMIGPRMATMLCVLMTDAALDPQSAQDALAASVDQSFNCISVDGHMSTNDTVLLLATGAAEGQPLAGEDLAAFRRALDEVAGELARAIPDDGEGATHLVTIDIAGARTREAAHRIAKTIAESPLVKTAIAGADPNWGRIVSAIGYSGAPFDPAKVVLRINGILLYEHGAPVEFDAAAVSSSIKAQRETSVVVDLADGPASLRFWTTDLTAEYVRLNADYHT